MLSFSYRLKQLIRNKLNAQKNMTKPQPQPSLLYNNLHGFYFIFIKSVDLFIFHKHS